MRIDGSKVSRLTDRKGDAVRDRVSSEFTPSFSPHGRHIAYTAVESSVDNFDYYPYTSHIWTMRRDGSGARQLNQHEYDDRPVFMPDGRIAFHGYKGRNDIYAMTAKGKDRVLLPELRFYDYGIAFSPDGQRVAFGNSSRENLKCYAVYTMAVDGTALARITAEPCEYDPAWSPGSDGLAFVRQTPQDSGCEGELVVTNPDGTEPRPVGTGCEPFWGPAAG